MKAHFFAHAQTGPVFPGALKEKRAGFKKEMIEKVILKNLALPLNKKNEEAWQQTFNAINLTKYEPQEIVKKISEAAEYLPKSSTDFKKEWLQLVNSDFDSLFKKQVMLLLKNAGTDDELIAMCATYLLKRPVSLEISLLQQLVLKRLKASDKSVIITELNEQLKAAKEKYSVPYLQPLFRKDFLPGEIVLYSIQRKNRNYPGMVMIRKADGSFLKNDDGSYFFVRQSTRSQGDMPYYISGGNTPQGIFRMDGFDTSKSFFMGPTTNIQLTMPFEFRTSHFFRDSTLKDSIWLLSKYKNLLPASLQNYRPLYESWYAGKAGRNEIIAHGTAIDPSFYEGRTYYPFTPSAGCLTTAEFWNDENGKIKASDQLILADALKKAGGANGYLIMIEKDDQHSSVSMDEILTYIK